MKKKKEADRQTKGQKRETDRQRETASKLPPFGMSIPIPIPMSRSHV
jgi:hypothetical protein